ncbi:MAG: glycosyltransferase family 2 protein [Candidatus Limivivens sp.]|nr:glycosyltransferase family 2 protein [Candidatus Limivivens sp.]
MCKVSVVIPNYNGSKYLKDCLESLNAQTFRDFEVIFVDNGSTDDSLELLARYCSNARAERLSENFGFCKAVNIGVGLSRAPYVLLLNNDTRAMPDFIQRLVETMEENPRCFSCAAHMYKMADPEKTDDAGDFFCALGWAFSRGKDKPVSDYQKPGKIFAACAGAAIYRRELMVKLGLFDERHFAYLEDIDLGYRARVEGYENRFEPSAVVYHVGSGTTGSRYNEFKVRYSARNNLYLIYKNMPLFQLILNAPLLLLGFGTKLVFFSLKGYGGEYRKGLALGAELVKTGKKYPFRWKNLGHYLKIQAELWKNIVLRFR